MTRFRKILFGVEYRDGWTQYRNARALTKRWNTSERVE